MCRGEDMMRQNIRLDRVTMRSLDSSKRKDLFKSVLFGSNEEFTRLYNEEFARLGVGITEFGKEQTLSLKVFEILTGLDRFLMRAEKNAQLHEFVAGIVHFFEKGIFPFLEESTYLWFFDMDQLFYCRDKTTCLEDLCALFTNSVASGRVSTFNVVVSAVVLLALVYQYLLGCVDKGGSKTYSSGSLDFRDSFVCIVLFRGAYVWIKFRPAAIPANNLRKRKSLESPHQASLLGSHDESPVSERGVYCRVMRDKSGTVTRFKYEPRFKPPRQKLDSNTTLKFDYLSLGSYDTHDEARIVRQIAAFYYGKEEGHVQLEDGLRFSIPSMSEQEKSLSGLEKAKWVSSKTKDVCADLLKVQAREKVQLLDPTLRTNPYFGGVTSDAIEFAEIEACGALGTNGSEFASLPAAAPSLGSEQFDWSSCFAGSEDMIDELSSFWANVPGPESGGLDNQRPSGAVTEIIAHLGGCVSQVAGAAAQDLEHREPQLTSPPMESPHGQVNHLQQLVILLKKELQDTALRIVELKHQLMESEVQKSELQREVESLRSMLQSATESQVATWSAFSTGVDIQ